MNDDDAQIVLDNMKLVHKICQKMRGYAKQKGLEYDDIVNIGAIGLMKAIQKFDPGYGVEFSTYAFPMIKGEIQRVFRDTNTGLKFGRRVKENARLIYVNHLEHENQETIASTLGISIQNVKDAFEYLKGPLYLDEVVYSNKDDDELELSTTVGNYDDDTQPFVEEFIRSLPKRERTIVNELMNGKTQDDIGEMIGVSQVQVSRLIKKLREKLLVYENEGGNEMSLNSKPELTKAKELLTTTNLSIDEIVKQTGANRSSVSVYASKLRNKNVSSVNEVAATSEVPVTNTVSTNREPLNTTKKYVTIKIPICHVEIPSNIETPQVDRAKMLDIGYRLIQNAIDAAYNDLIELLGTNDVDGYIQNYVERKLEEVSA